jgi:methionyl-tRNA formyltransferase
MTNLQYIGSIPGRVVKVIPQVGSVILTGDHPLLLTQVQLKNDDIRCAADVLNSINLTLGFMNE